ncbi:nitrate/sulfonate/bicarbonate ABC transporter ATP-binding protein [Acuticoccus sediminis]|uniref:Nitrate/sulfonate/bicarbonate ABC transporter ATP-binding protein n=1 Tax=Acuticoccus sediminis TaxID=2184697 RepID=A0A8B2NM44_9HYPH|nr:ABC transporter ATP-binding protein [Acuticoccus sediminis]RAH97434.1 nitrate/sulfonate/bicarbonate ABC transporter ATP-binding protein [Acuticoccus sediminis]
MSIAICLSKVSKWFARPNREPLHVLSDISFEVPRNSSVAIVGASGCGKSTLLNIIAGLLPPDEGEVLVDGSQPRNVPAAAVTYMFQDDRLLPWRSTASNVHFGLETTTLGKAERQARVAETLELVGLADFADAYPHELSGGMRSRAALARSLVARPSIMLMDEPFSKLDPTTRSQMHKEVVRIAREFSMTVVFVTHDAEEAVVLADKVIVLKPRPGRKETELKVDMPFPRDPVAADVTETVRSLRQII